MSLDNLYSKFNKKSSVLLISGTSTDDFISNNENLLANTYTYLNRKGYRVAYTGLSYRKINSLGVNNLLEDKRNSDRDWRLFSFKELIYLSLIEELRTYGIIDKNFTFLRDCFFSKKFKRDTDKAIVSVMCREQIIVVMDNEFDVMFYSSSQFLQSEGRAKSFIYVNLNEIFRQVSSRLGRVKIGYKTEYEKRMEHLLHCMAGEDSVLSKKEKAILDLIRNDKYKTITVRKKNNQTFIVKGEKTQEINADELVKLIKDKDFVDISIVKRDGNISSIKIEDSFKI